jgi:hypothetical protein
MVDYWRRNGGMAGQSGLGSIVAYISWCVTDERAARRTTLMHERCSGRFRPLAHSYDHLVHALHVSAGHESTVCRSVIAAACSKT